jgi:hypothetical protein
MLHKNVTKGDGSMAERDWFQYYCAHCDSQVSGAVIGRYDHTATKLLFCPTCLKGSVYVAGVISPSAKFGATLEGLPPDVASAYDEARRCMSVNAYVASELICRKILMHIAVDKGAKEGESFVSYLNHLEAKGYITLPIKGWADTIRQNANEATHELKVISRQRAEATVIFTVELLRLVYEMEYLNSKLNVVNNTGTN